MGYNDGAERPATYDIENKAFDFGYYLLDQVTFQKHIDRSTPLIEKMIYDRFDTYWILFSFYQKDPDNGELELILTKRFEGVQITETKIIIPNQADRSYLGIPMMQEVSFTFREATVTYPKTGDEATVQSDY